MMRRLRDLPALFASAALVLMVVIPLINLLLRPLAVSGIGNGSVIVQHMGLVMAMFGGVAAVAHGHISSLGNAFASSRQPTVSRMSEGFGQAFGAVICGVLCMASAQLVASERGASEPLAYGIPVWWIQACMPIGFALLAMRLGARLASKGWQRQAFALLPGTAGALLAWHYDGVALPLWPMLGGLLLALLCGAPIFTTLGALALALFWQDGQPLAAIALSHYQITVNPSLPALPLFTLAGLVFARTGAAARLGAVFVALSGGGVSGTVVSSAVLCSAFTAFTGGSGVTILALGGLLLPLLRNAGFPEQRGIALVTSASALGVLLAPSVPLIMFAIIAHVPINTMFLAGLIPAAIMVGFLLVFGGYLHRPAATTTAMPPRLSVWAALRQAQWEILAPVVVIGALASGLATPTESAAIAAAYAVLTQVLAHRALDWRTLRQALADCTQIIGGVMLILGMALALTNYLIDAGIPDVAIDWVQSAIPNKWVFLVALNLFLFMAGALMEIFAALVVLVPLLLPVALSYGIDPVHFGIIFLANMELGFLCPPAGMNIYFASAMFGKPVRYVAWAVLPSLGAIFLGTLAIAMLPATATWLPHAVQASPHVNHLSNE